MTIKIARRGMVPPFIVMDVLAAANERAAAGDAVYHLEVGQPSTPAPQGVIAAARRALDGERLGYTESLGTPALRRRIARHYRDWYGVDLDPARVVVTTGSSGAFLLAFLAAFDAGDRVALAAPGYPAYRNILTALGVEPVLLPVGANTRFQPTAALLDALLASDGGHIDGLIIASPSNPTGTMLDRQALADLAALCRRRGIRLVSDEIYHGITYGEAATSALGLTDQAIVINSFSKYFSMTGWRLGWAVLPADLVRPVECLTQNFFISPPALSQAAAIAAFDCHDELKANVARYAANRALLLDRLPRAGFERIAPADGAFYLYAAVDHLTQDSHDFCRRMLAETGVAATPGTDFDPQRGHRFVRFSFAGTTADMEAAADRLVAWRGGR
jgi:aspartate/methionine/tyrosine aminotransferase